MKILMASSEAVPYIKTGGLADMVSALSIALAKLGHDVRIVLPRYYSIDRSKLTAMEGPMGVPVGGGEEWCEVFTEIMPGSPEENVSKKESAAKGKKKTAAADEAPADISPKADSPKSPESKNIKVYFVEHEKYFGKDGVYGVPSEPDFLDNPQRFTFFSKSVFQLCRKINWYPDVIHAHDWPCSLVPVFLKFGERKEKFSKTVSILTIHNLGYQGVYYKDNFNYTGLGWDTFYTAGFEDWNMMNMLKAGLWSADTLNTVSQNYAEETKTSYYGCRLDGVLRYRSADYLGILNGIDTDVWNPEKDPFIPEKYGVNKMGGKAKAKEALQKEFGLPVDPDVPVVGFISRLTDQKGVGELFGPSYGSAFSICRDFKLQFVILGSGESWCENEIMSLASRLPNLKARIGYNNALSHLIEAGSDFFLMPSRYEPSGLNQMYSLGYGTIPIVRNTGGLTDTVENFNEETGEGTGFMFDDLTPNAIYNTVGWAVWTWYNRRKQIEDMKIRGMEKDFSWKISAKRYVEMYEWTRKKTFE